MKKTYFNPEAMIMTVASEDILTASKLTLIEGAVDGYDDDYESIGNMFKG